MSAIQISLSFVDAGQSTWISHRLSVTVYLLTSFPLDSQIWIWLSVILTSLSSDSRFSCCLHVLASSYWPDERTVETGSVNARIGSSFKIWVVSVELHVRDEFSDLFSSVDRSGGKCKVLFRLVMLWSVVVKLLPAGVDVWRLSKAIASSTSLLSREKLMNAFKSLQSINAAWNKINIYCSWWLLTGQHSRNLTNDFVYSARLLESCLVDEKSFSMVFWHANGKFEIYSQCLP